MSLSIRRHLSYANVVATMALVFAMSGSALAAKHYLITSTSQISPKVLKKLTGKAGNTGAPGAQGPSGASGKEGAPGKEGTPGKEGAPGNNGSAGKEGLSLLSETEQQKLLAILPYIKYVASGVDGKPTIQFSGVNLQIASGVGKEEAINGEGNLIIGYDESPGSQIGSDNLVLGDKQTYLSYGAVLGGEGNTASGEDTDVFGKGNTASGEWASVGGGSENIASGGYASVSGGHSNEATGFADAVSGGAGNKAGGEFYSSVSGGAGNTASEGGSVSGGEANEADGLGDSVSGGHEGKAKGFQNNDSVTGGRENTAEGEWASVSGGLENKATGRLSAILGGKKVTESTEYGVSP